MQQRRQSVASSRVVCRNGDAGTTVARVRSTLLTSSIEILRAQDHYKAYLAALPAQYHDTVLLTLAPTWHSVEVAMAHYAACDALRLRDSDIDRMGETVSNRLSDTFLATAVRTARGLGTSPWVALTQISKLWTRMFEGGELVVSQLGPKDMRVDALGLPMFEYHYFRVGFVALLRGTVGLFARSVVVRDQAAMRLGTRGEHALKVSISWV